jgi:hypothetical protein
LIDSLTFSTETAGQRTAKVAFHARGPVELDMPAYTLRGYSLHWAVTSPDGSMEFSKGYVSMPVMNPGTQWSGDITVGVPVDKYIISVSIVRPTGYTVTNRSYDPEGNLIP